LKISKILSALSTLGILGANQLLALGSATKQTLVCTVNTNIPGGYIDSWIGVNGATSVSLPLLSSIPQFNGGPNACTVTVVMIAAGTPCAVSCQGSDKIHVGYQGTSFWLQNQGDYVTFAAIGGYWYVVATNGPMAVSTQTAETTATAVNAWTAIGNGLALTIGAANAGIYDLELDVSLGITTGNVAIAIGEGTIPVSASVGMYLFYENGYVPAHVQAKGVQIAGGTTINGLYYGSGGGAAGVIEYNNPNIIGQLTARRVG
jgi:hypothetical protein